MTDATIVAPTNLPKPTGSNTEGNLALAAVIDAVNAVPNETARRMTITCLKERAPEVLWITKPGGYLDAQVLRPG